MNGHRLPALRKNEYTRMSSAIFGIWVVYRVPYCRASKRHRIIESISSVYLNNFDKNEQALVMRQEGVIYTLILCEI